MSLVPKRLLAVLASAALASGGAVIGGSLAPHPARPGSELAFGSPSPLPLTRGDAGNLVAAPDFAVRTIDGRTLRLADFRGRPAVLFFMAYWCSTCIPEAQALGRIHTEFAGRGVEVIAIDIDPTSSFEALGDFRDFAGKPAYDFALDIGGRTTRAFKVATLDTTVVIDRSGRIAYRDASVTDYGTLRDAVGRVI